MCDIDRQLKLYQSDQASFSASEDAMLDEIIHLRKKVDGLEHETREANDYAAEQHQQYLDMMAERNSYYSELEPLRERVVVLEAEAELGNIPYKEAIALKQRIADLEKWMKAMPM